MEHALIEVYFATEITIAPIDRMNSIVVSYYDKHIFCCFPNRSLGPFLWSDETFAEKSFLHTTSKCLKILNQVAYASIGTE